MSIARILISTVFSFLLAGPVYAAFYFDKSTVTIDVDPNDIIGKHFTRSVTVRFKTVCELRGCNPQGREQDYRFGLSSQYTAPRPSGDGSRSRPKLYHDDWLRRRLTKAIINPGNDVIPEDDESWKWSDLQQANASAAYWRTATFDFTFHRRALNGVQPGECQNFYLIGLDDEGIKFWDTLDICLRRKDNRKIKISHLASVPLLETNNTPANASVMPFCVYVSDGSDYILQTQGEYVDNFNQFNLSNGNDLIQYKIQFSPTVTGNDKWVPIAPGDAVTGKGNDLEDTECGGQNNARFRIHLNEATGNASGTYSDTVTVTVTPK